MAAAGWGLVVDCRCCCSLLLVLLLCAGGAGAGTDQCSIVDLSHSLDIDAFASVGRGRDGRSTEKTDVALRLPAELVRGAHDNGLCVAQPPACAPRVYSTAVGRIKELDWRGRGRG